MHLSVGVGLLIPAYRYAIRVWYAGQLIDGIETEVIGLSQRIMPPLQAILPLAVEGEAYRRVVAVSKRESGTEFDQTRDARSGA